MIERYLLRSGIFREEFSRGFFERSFREVCSRGNSGSIIFVALIREWRVFVIREISISRSLIVVKVHLRLPSRVATVRVAID